MQEMGNVPTYIVYGRRPPHSLGSCLSEGWWLMTHTDDQATCGDWRPGALRLNDYVLNDIFFMVNVNGQRFCDGQSQSHVSEVMPFAFVLVWNYCGWRMDDSEVRQIYFFVLAACRNTFDFWLDIWPYWLCDMISSNLNATSGIMGYKDLILDEIEINFWLNWVLT